MRTSEYLQPGQVYTRNELMQMFDIADATIRTGVFRPRGHESVWLFITQEKTTDMPQYHDLLDGDVLRWDGQSSGRTDPLIIEHAARKLELLVFYRRDKYEYPGSGFRYEGPFQYVSHSGAQPTHFVLRRVYSLEAVVARDLDSLQAEEASFEEGGLKNRFTNYYERDSRIRAATIRHHGMKCCACGFDFEQVYGERGKGFIEVHHLKPVSSLREPTKIDPRVDLVVVCSNCHRMIHRNKDQILSIEQLKQLMWEAAQ
jgi:hypothetical protein